MKPRHFLLSLLALFACITTKAAVGDTFTAATTEGVSVTYKIISDNTVMVGDESMSSVSIAPTTTGTITIPSTVENEGTTYTVTQLGFRAFHQCEGLTIVNLPSTITTFGQAAFARCTSLTTVNIPEGITSISNEVFWGCTSLASITLPASLTSLAEGAFYNCPLTTVTVNATTPPSCTTGTYEHFTNAANCTLKVPAGTGEAYTAADVWKDFKEIIDPNTFIVFEDSKAKSICVSKWDTNKDGELSYAEAAAVTIIPVNGFYNETSLYSFMELKYFTNLTSIGEKAFYGCSNLTSISIPTNVATYGSKAFEGCGKLKYVEYASIEALCNNGSGVGTSNPLCYGYLYINGEEIRDVVVPSSVTALKEYTYYYCSYLKSVTIPSSVTSIGYNIVSGYTFMIFKSSTPITYNNFGAAAYFVPDDAVDTYKAAWTSVADKIYGESDYNLKSYTITAKESSSALLEAIGGEGYTSRIFRLKISGTINSYDMMIMRNKMTNLRELDLSDATIVANSYNYGTGVSQNNVFPDFLKEKETLYSIILPNTITSISANALSGTRIKSIVIPASVISISNGSTSGTTVFPLYLSEVEFAPSSQLTTLNIGAFAGTGLRTFDAPSSLKYIGKEVFKGCNSISSVILNEGLISIGEYAFQKSSLAQITLPQSLTTIGSYAFDHCSELKSIAIPSVQTINSNTFSSCTNLKEVKLSPQTTTIQGAFSACSSLKEIHLPPRLKSIANYAFQLCDKLKTIYAYMPDIISIGSNTFPNMATTTLYVPDFLYNSYYYDTNWSQFLHVNRCDLRPGDYESFYTNSDIIFEQGVQRITEDTPIAEIGSQGGVIVQGEPQQFDTVDQTIGDMNSTSSTGASLIGDGTTAQENNLPMNELRVKMTVQAKKWYFFCFPFDVTIEQCEYPGRYAWRYYDGAVRATNGSGGWQPVTDETLTARQGYAFQSETAGTLVVKFNRPTFGGNRVKELVAHAAENAANASWNFIGNPYSSYYDFRSEDITSPITIWNGSSYVAYRPGDDECHLKPYQAFFIQKPTASVQVTFNVQRRETYRQSEATKAARQAKRKEQGINPKRRLINLQIMDGEEEMDRARIVLNNEAQHAYELECDAAKFLSDDSKAQIYSVEGGLQMAINERPQQGDIRLGYTAKKPGRLSISAPRMDMPMVLVDKKLGITFDLTLGTYDFDTQAGTFDDRFLLSPSKDATAINQLTDKTGVCLGMQDGGLAIGGAEGKLINVYTTDGAQVASHTGNGFVALKGGIYVVKVDGESVKVSVK